jgi:hypothetical protein
MGALTGTPVALFAGLVELTVGAAVSPADMLISSVTAEPSRFAVVLPLYKTVPALSLAATRKFLALPLGTEKVSVMEVWPATETSFVIVVISEALMVKVIELTGAGIAAIALSDLMALFIHSAARARKVSFSALRLADWPLPPTVTDTREFPAVDDEVVLVTAPPPPLPQDVRKPSIIKHETRLYFLASLNVLIIICSLKSL